MASIGNYRILKKIGEGGFGLVYQAQHKLIGDHACLKQNKVASPVDAGILLEEAKLLWKLEDHHSIPSVKDIFEVEENNYVMAMSYINGPTLEDVVAKKGPLHPEDASWITERLLGALYYCHSYGVVHTDVKPANVFVEAKKRDIKLIDFGLAEYKPVHTTKPRGFTPAYAAPELHNGQPPIPETDLFGAGIVLLYALGGDTGKKEVPDYVPEPLKEFCLSLLRYDPMERPNWEKNNPLERLSDIRQEVFGRRHMM